MAVMKPVLGPLSSYASGIIVEEIIAMIPPAANEAIPAMTYSGDSAKK